MSNILYDAKSPKLLQALRDGGITKENVGSGTCLYVEGGIIKATNDKQSVSPDVLDDIPLREPIGFWLWTSSEKYEEAMNGIEDIFKKIDAGFDVNLRALKEML